MNGLAGTAREPGLPPTSLRQRVRRTGPLIVALVLSTWLLYDHVVLVRAQEALARDAQIRARAVLGGERDDSRVAVVRITDADYGSLFRDTSPLDPAAVQRLLDAVLQGRPRLVGVDLDTSDPAFRSLKVPPGWAERIVWARGALVLCDCARGAACGVSAPVSSSDQRRFRYCPRDESGVLVPMSYLGGRNTGPAGLASLRNDDDGSIRRFTRAIAMPRDTYPTFAYALAIRAGRVSPSGADRARYISYRPLAATMTFTASQVIGWAHVNPRYDALQGRIVLIGGSYWAARDEYPTPLGQMPGVDIHAQIVESEIGGDAPAAAGGVWVLAALFASSLGLLWFLHVHGVRKALRRTLLIWIPVTATVFSLLGTGSPFTLWPYLVPVQLLIVLHQVAGEAEEYRQDWLRRVLPLTPDGRVDPQGSGPRLAFRLWRGVRHLLEALRPMRIRYPDRSGPPPRRGAPPAPAPPEREPPP